MADRPPRPSTDQGKPCQVLSQTFGPTSRTESAPLLRDPDAEDGLSQDTEPTFIERVNAIAQEPLTPLTKVLLVVGLVLLLLTSVRTSSLSRVQRV